jgi:hypothetical protein
MSRGEFQESKLFSTIGKLLCILLLYKHAEVIVLHENVLFVLMLFLIMPDLVKKFFSMRFGSGGRTYTERTEHTERETSVKTGGKIDRPD